MDGEKRQRRWWVLRWVLRQLVSGSIGWRRGGDLISASAALLNRGKETENVNVC